CPGRRLPSAFRLLIFPDGDNLPRAASRFFRQETTAQGPNPDSFGRTPLPAFHRLIHPAGGCCTRDDPDCNRTDTTSMASSTPARVSASNSPDRDPLPVHRRPLFFDEAHCSRSGLHCNAPPLTFCR